MFLLQHGSAKEQGLNASKVCYCSLFKVIDSLIYHFIMILASLYMFFVAG